MGTKGKYTADEATQRFLDLMKRANPSDEVRIVIGEIEGEIGKPASRPKKRRQPQRRKQTA